MTQTLAVFIPLLQFLVAGGSAALAALWFAQIRRDYPPPDTRPPQRLVRLWYWLLHGRMGKLISATVLAGVISLGAAVVLAWLTDGDVLSVTDAQIAILLSTILNQYIYQGLLKRPTESGSGGQTTNEQPK